MLTDGVGELVDDSKQNYNPPLSVLKNPSPPLEHVKKMTLFVSTNSK